ncbi:hypothetical protein GQ54DRAFT_6837 [Martensiomyces pterosporus]|nr:hypothetical protein GQ54DRAFT_6837 [Martensiomyces pterosporus]
MLPPIPQASPGIPSFSLSGASLVSGVNSSSNTAGTTDIGDFQFNRSLVTPTTPTNNFSDNCGQSPSAAYAFTPSSSPMSASQYHQQHQSMRLVSLPISQSYSHQPTTQHSQSTGMLLNGQPITPISSTQAAQSATHGRPPRNKSKFKRFRNAFIYFVNDQRTSRDNAATTSRAPSMQVCLATTPTTWQIPGPQMLMLPLLAFSTAAMDAWLLTKQQRSAAHCRHSTPASLPAPQEPLPHLCLTRLRRFATGIRSQAMHRAQT